MTNSTSPNLEKITNSISSSQMKELNMAHAKQLSSHKRLDCASKTIMPVPSFILFLLYILLCKLSTSQIHCTGVVEIELVNLQRLDNTQAVVTTRSSTEPLLRVLVCLKEAYASQLDGPCAFGSANITLGIQSTTQAPRQTIDDSQQHRQITMMNNKTENAVSREADQQQQHQQTADTRSSSRQNQATLPARQSGLERQQQGQGSQLTNVVRIPFTFRWTKAFTIILTLEQMNESTNGATIATNGPAQQLQQQISARTNQSTDSAQSASSPSAPLPVASTSNGTSLATSNSAGSVGGNHQLAKPLMPAPAFIDRHISTENEVLPSLETSPNKFWTTRFVRGLKSSLVYRFRVYCSLNYHGDGCTTFCRPRDDQFGHYNCSASGQKICLDGWHGHDCDKAKCRAGCNQQHGYCDKPDTCQCRHGWEGPRCDECTKYPGCQNGYCLQPWQCSCNRNWGGVLCDQDLNYCGTHEPCANNATCQNVAPGRYKCHCPDGFTGVNCEIKLSTLIDLTSSMTQLSAGCALNPCLNGGTCYGFNSQLIESAGSIHNRALTEVTMDTTAAIASGEQVETLSLASGELADESNAGVLAQATGRSYRCQCPAGFTGDYCQWAESISLMGGDLSPINTNDSGANYSTPSFSTTFSSSSSNEDEPTLVAAQTVAGVENGSRLLPPPLEQQEVGTSSGPPPNTIISAENIVSSQTWLGPVPSGAAHHLEMRHLISGVVIASAIGVFCAALMLAWCCLMAIEKGGFSFIQMNIVRHGESSDNSMGSNVGGVSSTLRRVHEKIRDSFRKSSRTIRLKPDGKPGLDNAFGPPVPPPSYEESNNDNSMSNANTTEYHRQQAQPALESGCKEGFLVQQQQYTSNAAGCTSDEKMDTRLSREHEEPIKHDSNLVKRGALQEKIALKKSLTLKTQPPMLDPSLLRYKTPVDPIMNCPKHGHLYRKHQQQLHDNYAIATNYPTNQQASTTIEMAYKPKVSQNRSQEMVVYSQVNRHRNRSQQNKHDPHPSP